MMLVINTFPESYVNAANVLQLPEGAELEALHCQPSKSFGRSTKLELTTEPPIFLGAVRHWCIYFINSVSYRFYNISLFLNLSLMLYFPTMNVLCRIATKPSLDYPK